ncbi:MAG TPA: succinate dehydrogenase, hydrophobic membrane anchor protein [Steroidobacteraceae bacterium]
MSLRAPSAAAAPALSAREGMRHWLAQRVTALALAPLVIWLLIALLRLPAFDYASVIHWLGAGAHPVLLALIVLLATWHAWLGVQVVIEDYVHGPPAKSIALLCSMLVHLALGAGGLYALMRIALRTGA